MLLTENISSTTKEVNRPIGCLRSTNGQYSAVAAMQVLGTYKEMNS